MDLLRLIAFNGLYSFAHTIFDQLGPDFTALYKSGNETAFNNVAAGLFSDPTTTANICWCLEQEIWFFEARNAYDRVTKVQKYILDGVVQNITTPVIVGDAQSDMFPSVRQSYQQRS